MILIVGGAASGKRAYAASLGLGPDDVALDVHERVRAGVDVRALAAELAGKGAVTCAEVGSGIVPADAAGRAWREDVGRLCQLLAARACAVVRMVCGIPVPLKGALPVQVRGAAPACESAGDRSAPPAFGGGGDVSRWHAAEDVPPAGAGEDADCPHIAGDDAASSGGATGEGGAPC